MKGIPADALSSPSRPGVIHSRKGRIRDDFLRAHLPQVRSLI